MNKEIDDLWKMKCGKEVRDTILEAIAKDERLGQNTILSVRETYFYKKNVPDHEAPVILDIIRNALRDQVKKIDEKILT